MSCSRSAAPFQRALFAIASHCKPCRCQKHPIAFVEKSVKIIDLITAFGETGATLGRAPTKGGCLCLAIDVKGPAAVAGAAAEAAEPVARKQMLLPRLP